jgi:hypothetical protein
MRVLARCVGKHEILTYASAIAFQLLIALVALVLFGLALLGTLGRETDWIEQLAPFVQEKFTRATTSRSTRRSNGSSPTTRASCSALPSPSRFGKSRGPSAPRWEGSTESTNRRRPGQSGFGSRSRSAWRSRRPSPLSAPGSLSPSAATHTPSPVRSRSQAVGSSRSCSSDQPSGSCCASHRQSRDPRVG